MIEATHHVLGAWWVALRAGASGSDYLNKVRLSGAELMAEPYFPEEALAALREARFDPAAVRSLELLSGMFLWHDEGYLEFVAHCRAKGCLAYWEPLLYRDSLIRGMPDEKSRRGWELVQRLCPNWPGLRPERRSESLLLELEQALAEEL